MGKLRIIRFHDTWQKVVRRCCQILYNLTQIILGHYFYSIADINECSTSDGGCHANATCTNTVGSRMCKCYQGYDGNGTSCVGKQLCCLIIIFITYKFTLVCSCVRMSVAHISQNWLIWFFWFSAWTQKWWSRFFLENSHLAQIGQNRPK